jgi:hypothetical protein
MNDLVFVMCNLKLNNNQVKKQADDFGVEDDLSSYNDWITEGEKHSNIDLLGVNKKLLKLYMNFYLNHVF